MYILLYALFSLEINFDPGFIIFYQYQIEYLWSPLEPVAPVCIFPGSGRPRRTAASLINGGKHSQKSYLMNYTDISIYYYRNHCDINQSFMICLFRFIQIVRYFRMSDWTVSIQLISIQVIDDKIFSIGRVLGTKKNFNQIQIIQFFYLVNIKNMQKYINFP